MKNIYSLFSIVASVVFLLVISVGLNAQTATVTYTSGTFDEENAWQLVNTSTNTLAACYATATTGPSMQTVPVTPGDTYELYGYESFGDAWTGDLLSLTSTGGISYMMSPPRPQCPFLLSCSGVGCGSPTPPSAANGGMLLFSFVAQAPTCVMTCPPAITVSTSPDVCESGPVTIPSPTFSPPGCNVGVAGDFTQVCGPAAQLQYNATGLIQTQFNIPGVSPIDPALTCVSEVCVDVLMIADIGGAGFEQTNILGEDGTTVLGQNGTSAGDCNPAGAESTVCIPVALYNSWAADGTLNLFISTDADIDNICATQTIEGCVNVPGTCADYFNDYNGASDIVGENFPLGTTSIIYTSTASGTGELLFCETSVTVVDTQAPTLTCPGDQTFNLQGGECEEILTFTTNAEDNCPSAPFSAVGPFCDPCADPSSGSALACAPFAQNSIIQLVDIGGVNGTITQVCYNQETFGNTPNATFNIYANVGGPIPWMDGAGTFDPILLGSQTYLTSVADNGDCVCVDFDVPVPINSSNTSVWVEVFTPGTTLNSRIVQTPATCDGNNATGTNSFIAAPACGLIPPAPFAAIGFILDASYSLTITPAAIEAVPDPNAPVGYNQFESGDEFPIGTHCFQYIATDGAGNTATCDWCFTVNEFPEAQQVTSIACNDIVNVSLDEGCLAEIGADMFLEGGPYGCYETDYTVQISGFSGDQNGAMIPLDCGTTYTVTVTDVDTGISCWGEMLVEDKLAPVLTCAEDITLNCLQSTEPGETFTGVASVSAPANSATWSDATTGLVASQTLTVPPATTGAVITNVTVDVQMSHSWIGDLDMFITGPDGTVVQLLNSSCGTNDNINATFDDNAGNPVACVACALGGVHESCNDSYLTCSTVINEVQPASFTAGGNGLGDFAGVPLGGDFTIQVFDNVGGDGGCLEGLALNVEYAVPAPGSPTIANECGGETLTYSDRYFDNQCDGSLIQRTWIATDECGNSGTCVQNIFITQIGADGENSEWFWPESPITLDCDAATTPEEIYEFFSSQFAAQFPQLPNWIANPDLFEEQIAEWECNVDAAGVRRAYPYFINTKGLPQSFLSNNCNMLFTYDDLVIPACGPGCSGNSKIIRTWTALDWCTAETRTSVQVIHAKDITPPTFDLQPAMTVSASPWGCAATFYLPIPDHLLDNCDGQVTYRVYGKPGTVAEGQASPFFDAGVGAWRVNGLPKAGGPHEYIYEVSDCCGNISTQSLIVTVVDGSAPIAVAKQNIVISLTSNPSDPTAGSAKLYAPSVDNGSHDGDCGPVRIAVRRTDDQSCNNLGLNDHNNNSTFFNFNNLPNSQQPVDHDRDDTDLGEFVKFCCADLTGPNSVDEDGDGIPDYAIIKVELGVWDDANMDGIPGTPGDLFGLTWADVRVEAKLQPQLICPPKAMITCDMDENDDFVIDNMLGRATANSTCGPLNTTYEDVCGYDINNDGKVENWVVAPNTTFFVNESVIMWDVNGDGFISNYTATGGQTIKEDLFNKACHYGPIMRYWSVEGTGVTCRQVIIISEPTTLFDGNTQIDWPYSRDEFINLVDNDGRADCNGDGISNDVSSSDITLFPDNNEPPTYAEVKMDCIDALCEEPAWVEANCALIGWTLDSDTFRFEGDACRKIINKYTVIDWCQYNLNDPETPGIWTWTVIGKLIDPFAPEVTAEDDMFPAVPGVGGSGTPINEAPCVGVGITMSATATDKIVDADGDTLFNACPSQWLKWNVYLDINNDWVYEREWSSFVQEDRNTSTDPLWSEDNAADNIAVYGYPIPDVRVGNRGGVDNATDLATPPGFEYTINIPDQIPADCGETQHRVVWKAYDGCGNVTSVTSYFTVQDKKAPTPYCINLSTALMADPDGPGPETPMVELWAIDFDAGSFDNCTEYEDLRFTFTDTPPELDSLFNEDLNSSSHIFRCEDMNGVSPAFLTLPIYVWDECGNYDFCLVNLRLVDNNTTPGTGCEIDSAGSRIAGLIETPFGASVENVEVMNQSSIPDFNAMQMTDNTGNYLFGKFPNDLNYNLSGTKNDDYLNGVSTLDLLMIQRHILGIQLLDDPYKILAADVNNDQKVTAVDLIELRKLILGIYEELPNNGSWRFGDANQVLDINNPWALDEMIEINNLSTDMMHEDFVAIKIGDVNESVIANSSAKSSEDRSTASIEILYEDRNVAAGELIELTIAGSSLNDVYGYQFTMATGGLELVNVESGAITVTPENFASFGNVVTTSWHSVTPVSTDDVMFTMTFRSAVSGRLSDIIAVNSNITRAEAYVGSDLKIVDIDVDNNTGSAEFALYQNEPNPFATTTVIGFDMPETADATLTVYDVTGKVIKIVNGNYTQGYNEIELSKSDLGAAGVLYYQLDSGDFTATKKMIIIE